MFFIVETTKHLDTHNETTSFGYNRVYDTYEEAERDLATCLLDYETKKGGD